MKTCIISPQASQDLDELSTYFLSRNIEVGERLLEEFNKKCLNLVNFPNLGRSYEFLRPGMRGLPLDGYIIFYQLVGFFWVYGGGA